MRAALYGRFSTESQTAISIDGQFRNCVEFCKRKDFEIVARFSDEAITGTDDTRPGYRALLDSAERGDFDVIVVDETSRLTRNPSTLLSVIDQLTFRNQALLDVRGFDSRDQSAILMAGVLGGVDRLELVRIRSRTHRGLRERALTGHWTGGLTYGYRSVPVDANDPESKRKLVVVPEEAEIVREIFELYADGMSTKAIANLLNERRVPSPGSRWNRTKRRTTGWVHTALCGTADRDTGALRNELYVGKMIWNKRRSKKVPGTSKRRFEIRPRSEWVVVDAPELRIVPEAVWTRVQQRLAANRERSKERRVHGHGLHVSRYMLSGLLKCGVCGGNFIMANAVIYRCTSWTNGGRHCCSNGLTVRRDVVEPIVLRGVKHDLLSDEALAEVRKFVADAQRSKKSDREIADRELRKLDAAIERVTEAIAEVGMSRALREKLAVLEAQRAELELQVQSVKSGPIEMVPRVIDRWRGLVDGFEELARHPDARPADIDEARERLGRLLGDIPLMPEEGHLVAEVGLQSLDLAEPYIGVVAGVGFEPTTFGL